MATRDVSTAIKYVISVTEQGLKAAVGLTTDLGKQSKVAQAAVDSSQKAIQAQYKTLESIAVKADQSVAKAAIDSATVVNKALDTQIAKLREAGSSYAAIMAQQRAMGASAAELAASIKRSADAEIASMQAVRAEADRTVRQRLSLAASGIGGRVGGAASSVARGVGGAAIGALGVGGALAVTGLEKSRSVTEGTLAIRGSTGLPTNQALALATIATSLGIAPRSIGQAFGTLGGRTTQALAGNATSGALFSSLGISRATVAKNVDNPLALFDLVTSRAATLPATQQAAVQRSLLGRGSSIVGQLTAGGPLTASVSEVEKNLPGLDPKKLIAMQEAFVHLKEVTTAFELSFAQAFGPAIGKGLQAIIPLLKPIATGFQDAFNVIKGVVNGPVGQGLAKFGEMAFASGKKLIEAFKPAEPFLKNVILPLFKGVAEGIGIGIVGAIKIATPIVKVISDILGVFGNLLKPLKPIIEDIGQVLGIVFGPGVIGKAIEFVAKLTGDIPFAGKVLGDLIKPVELVGEGIGKLFGFFTDVFAKIFGFLPGIGPKIGQLLGTAATAVLNVFAAIPGAVGGLAGDFVNLGKSVVSWIVSGIQSIPDTITKAIVGLLPKPIQGAASSILGAVGQGVTSAIPGLNVAGLFAQGGLVPAMLSPGEQMIYGGMSAMVPGPRAAADNVLAFVPPGTAIMTGHGQAMMGMGASLGDALAMQAPHFAAGGTVNALGWNVAAPKGSGGGRGPKATMRYVNHLPVGPMTTAQWQAYEHAHPKVSAAQGLTFSGPASTFGPPGEAAGSTAYGASSSQPGLALNPHGGGNWNDALARSLAGKSFRIEGAGHSAVLKVIDKGPSAIGSHGPRLIDITGAGVTAMGLNPSAFPTDSIFKATEVVGGVASAITKLTAAGTSPTAPTLANLLPSLTGQTAFAGGYQAGLSGNTLTDTLRSGVLSSLIGDVAITKSGLVGGTQPTGTSSLTGAGAFTGRLGAMVAKAGEIAGHNYPYLWGGGHNSSFSAPYDCCLVPDSLVYTPHGPKRILDIGAGDEVYTWDEGKLGVNRVVCRSEPRHQQTYALKTTSRSIEASGNHPFLRVAPVGEHVPGQERRWDREWVELDDLKVGDWLVTAEHLDRLEGIPEGWEADPEFWWLVGAYIGDGCFDYSDKPTGRVHICLLEDDERERAERVIERLVGRKPRRHPTHGLMLTSRRLREKLDQHGVTVRSHERRVPSAVWTLPEQHARAFLAGYQRTDGSWCRRDRCWQYGCTSETLIREVRALHIALGDGVTKVGSYHRPTPYSANPRRMWRFATRPEGRRYGAKWRGMSAQLSREMPAGGPFTLEVVRSIEPLEKRDTYDITVEGAHNFIAEGLVVHNSGAVSAVLHAGGALKSPLVSGDLMHWGQPGKGKNVSIFSSPTHTFMQLAGRYFGTSGSNPGGGANWIAQFPEAMPATTHPPGMRAGGIAGKGIPFRPKTTKRVNPLSAPLGLVGSLIGRDDSTDVSSIMAAIAAQLDDVHAQTFQSLQSLAANLAHHSLKGLDPIQQRRLSSALNLVDAVIGNRIGLSVAAAQNAVDAISRQNAHKVASFVLAGGDTSSASGLAQAAQLDKVTVQGLNAQVGVLNQALATAKKYGDKATIKSVSDSLNAALANLDTAAVQALNDWKAAVEKVAQDAVDASSQSLSLAQGGQQILSLQQQLAGTDQTPGGGQQMAAYITSTIIPALQKQFAAQQADQAAAGSVGDAARVNQDILAEQQSQTAILQAQLDAQNAIKQTSAASANALKQAGGQLAFNFNGQNGFTDRGMASLGVGT